VGVAVEVAAEADVAVAVAVEVNVCEGVAEALKVGVTVPVEEMGVEVDPGLGFDVEVRSGGTYSSVFVGLIKNVAGIVANAVVVGTVVCVVPAVDVPAGASAVVANCVTVETDAPGVRYAFIQAGFVRMAGSTGSMNPPGLLVRKSLFGSILDSTFVSNSQRGVKRSAQPPASRIHKSPNRRMKTMTTQSRLSFSVVLMSTST